MERREREREGEEEEKKPEGVEMVSQCLFGDSVCPSWPRHVTFYLLYSTVSCRSYRALIIDGEELISQIQTNRLNPSSPQSGA